jgi:Arc/MetJ-type ribon-helix-helix transcriptional regulator
VSQSEAIRAALVEAANRRRKELLAKEARRVAADPKDRAEKAEILALMDSLRPEWPPE